MKKEKFACIKQISGCIWVKVIFKKIFVWLVDLEKYLFFGSLCKKIRELTWGKNFRSKKSEFDVNGEDNGLWRSDGFYWINLLVRNSILLELNGKILILSEFKAVSFLSSQKFPFLYDRLIQGAISSDHVLISWTHTS